MKTLGYIFGLVISVAIIVLSLTILFNLVAGSLQLAHWLVTGELFHIASTSAVSAF